MYKSLIIVLAVCVLLVVGIWFFCRPSPKIETVAPLKDDKYSAMSATEANRTKGSKAFENDP